MPDTAPGVSINLTGVPEKGAGTIAHRSDWDGLGKIGIRDGYGGAYGIYEATVVLTCADRTQYHRACANGSAVSFNKAHTDGSLDLPLFQPRHRGGKHLRRCPPGVGAVIAAQHRAFAAQHPRAPMVPASESNGQ